ncbi:MAG: Dabb family protein [Planctomycetaceae bacterium]|nr:Dabb family protein [Planctomycetaceae bacterium]
MLLSHMVYFTLRDSSAEACQNLVDACHRYLKPHDGVTFFAAGTLAPGYERPVNDRAFHVALNTVFESREAHDAYQVSPNHLKFIEENKGNWESVRVFDAEVA